MKILEKSKNMKNLRKWEYVSIELDKMKAPKKVINAAKTIDNIMIENGLGWNTEEWNYRCKEWNDEPLIDTVNYDFYCSSWKQAERGCDDCIIGGNILDGCTPRSIFADDYYHIVRNYIWKNIRGFV